MNLAASVAFCIVWHHIGGKLLEMSASTSSVLLNIVSYRCSAVGLFYRDKLLQV